jgi:hypothetical protein
VESSWLRVGPQRRVRVLFTADLYPFAAWLEAGLKQVRVRAQVSEWKFEDSRYFIQSESQPVLSGNAMVIDLAPAPAGR